MLNDLLVATGDAPIEGTEEVMGFKMKDNGKLVLVKQPAGEPEILAAFGEAMLVNLPFDAETYNRCLLTYLHYLRVFYNKPNLWRRFKIAQSKHVLDRISA
jgi:hypothetical protein